MIQSASPSWRLAFFLTANARFVAVLERVRVDAPFTLSTAGISFGASYWTDRSRYFRDERAYWRRERLDAYVAFVVVGKRYMSILHRVAASRRLDDQTEMLSMREAEPCLADAFQDREAAFERLRLVAGEDVSVVARAWVQHFYAMRNTLDDPDLDRTSWQE